jgi:fumarylacetoacetase
MTYQIDETHDPAVKSWVESANRADHDFPIQNLPFGVCRLRGSGEEPHVSVAIGDFALDISQCSQAGRLRGDSEQGASACASSSLNKLLALGPSHWTALRRRLHAMLRSDARDVDTIRSSVEKHLLPLSEAEFFVPAEIGDYTDFYASIYHASTVGKLFRPDNPLSPNYKYIPVGYHGRASSIVVNGTPVRRPAGQTRSDPSQPVRFGPSTKLDYELEIGFFTGPGNPLGESIPIADAESHIFGLCLLNDWSARDIQSWESQPLGPFLAKNFATSVSPWVVTLGALAPFRTSAFERPAGDPALLPYLASPEDRQHGGIDLTLEVFLISEQMRHDGHAPLRLSRGNFRDMYWTIAQMLAHHTSNGCNLWPGDLLASGTVSGPANDSFGCLLELAARGIGPIQLPTGETRSFLADGDEVILRAGCDSPGATHIGFGECRGLVVSTAT